MILTGDYKVVQDSSYKLSAIGGDKDVTWDFELEHAPDNSRGVLMFMADYAIADGMTELKVWVNGKDYPNPVFSITTTGRAGDMCAYNAIIPSGHLAKKNWVRFEVFGVAAGTVKIFNVVVLYRYGQ